MKRTHFFLTATVMALILTASVLSPVNPTGYKSTTPMITDSIPGDLQLIFSKSCMACHASGGNHMAMSKLNFSEWANYEPAKQAKKAEAICNVLAKGAMPPKSFRQSHPDVIPTEAQKDTICKWSETLAQKK
jgi:cytochrome c5